MRRLPRRILKRAVNNPFGDLGGQRRHPRGPGLVAQQAFDTLLHETFLPAPHAGLRRARPSHDCVHANTVGAQQHNLGPPDVLLRRVAIPADAVKALPVGQRKADRNPGTHAD